MSFKKENIFVEHFDRILLDFIENSRKLIEKKISHITIELRDLKEENERLILQFTRQFLTSPEEYKKYLSINSLNTFNTTNSLTATPITKNKSTKTIKANDFISRNITKLNMDSKDSHSINLNKSSHFSKPFNEKYKSHDKAKIEVKKKKKRQIVFDKMGAKLNSSHISNGLRNTESSLTNDIKKHKSNKMMGKWCLEPEYNTESMSRTKAIPLSNKDKAVHSLIQSKVLTLQEKMFFYLSNSNVQSHITKRKILEGFKALIKEKIKNYGTKTTFNPSSTAKNCLSFIKPIDEEEFKLLPKKSNAFELSSLTGQFKLLYALLGISSEQLSTSDMIHNLYFSVFKKYNITSIKQLIMNVICPKIRGNHSYQTNVISEIMQNYDNCFETDSYLVQNRVPSFISFILKEIADFLIDYDYNNKQFEVYQAVQMKLDGFLIKS